MPWKHALLKLLWVAPAVGAVQFGSLRRTKPISRNFGYDRGEPIDRYYIEKFLTEHRTDIRGRVLEIQENTYASKLGGENVHFCEILHVREGNPHSTVVADLSAGAPEIESDRFDCIIMSQTLQFIYDVRPAIQTIRRILKPGGIVLATAHGISALSRYDVERWGEYWRFTSMSLRMMFEEVFPKDAVNITVYGSVLTAISSLHGISTNELTSSELQERDADYELIIGVRAVKPVSGTAK